MKNKKNLNFRKILNLVINLFAGKNKKSFSSLIYHITETYEKDGLINHEEKHMFRNMVNFSDKKVSTIMVPSSDIICISEDISLNEIKKIITEDEHTRIPVYRDNIDHIVGFIHSKDLAKFLCNYNLDFDIKKIMRKILFVPHSMKLLEVFLRMRSSQVHIAIILDEFGGVDGLVTIENLLEQIVGQIDDEHDTELESSYFQIKKIDDFTYRFGGRVAVKKFEEIFNLKFEDCNAETVGGLSMFIFKNIPKIGDKIEKNNLIFKIIDSDQRIVKIIEISKKDEF